MKNEELVNGIKGVWENDHAEEISKAYNKIVKILSKMDIYSANVIVNLVTFQTIQKSISETVGRKVTAEDIKKEEEVIE